MGGPTGALIPELLGLGFKTIATCVSEQYLDRSFVGRLIDKYFLRDLPASVDPLRQKRRVPHLRVRRAVVQPAIAWEKGEIVRRQYNAPAPPPADEYDYASTDPSPFDPGFGYCDLV